MQIKNYRMYFLNVAGLVILTKARRPWILLKIFTNSLRLLVPAYEQLKELVLTLQNHKHSTYCKKRRNVGSGCRFNFPQPPNYNTLISEPNDDDDDTLDTVSNVLSKVRKELINNNACVGISLDELLTT